MRPAGPAHWCRARDSAPLRTPAEVLALKRGKPGRAAAQVRLILVLIRGELPRWLLRPATEGRTRFLSRPTAAQADGTPPVSA